MSRPRAILHVTIRGQVQGVGYRAWVEYQAAASHLEGWVRNRRDGSVEAVFAGLQKRSRKWLRCAAMDRPRAKIEAVLKETAEAEQLDLRQAGEAFSVLPTV